jgi:hypothetical protein
MATVELLSWVVLRLVGEPVIERLENTGDTGEEPKVLADSTV